MINFDKVYISDTSNPYMNLAIEDQILKGLKSGEKVIFIYKNTPCVVMGRFQNPWIEVNLKKMKELGVKLVRRQSGGGCVYHDEENLNFCFLYGDKDYRKEENNNFLIHLLKSFNIAARVNERSDLVLDLDKTYKFSGSAFKQKKDRSFHHCTFLLNSDLSHLNTILDSPLKHLKSKSTPSKRSHVKNLQTLNPDINFATIVDFVKKNTEKALTIENLEKSDYLDFLKSWDWIYGETPLFEIPLKGEEFILNLELRKAKILKASFEGSSLEDEKSLNNIQLILEGKSLYEREALSAELDLAVGLGPQISSILKASHLI